MIQLLATESNPTGDQRSSGSCSSWSDTELSSRSLVPTTRTVEGSAVSLPATPQNHYVVTLRSSCSILEKVNLSEDNTKIICITLHALNIYANPKNSRPPVFCGLFTIRAQAGREHRILNKNWCLFHHIKLPTETYTVSFTTQNHSWPLKRWEGRQGDRDNKFILYRNRGILVYLLQWSPLAKSMTKPHPHTSILRPRC